ncbi:hypothetical protein FOB58_001413 [Candida parapsilosis]|uniref:Uncharacterized protein n=2 Tax=Candida parapsilosis TaxID=5480 RepID=G8BBD6_CANPC|nr:uncharacterized protein CPAR2_800030 [Candida parapsilosis]KAF6051353.1 hypothetical protein FOB58_001413 [Candida parapsilosis]KAF6053150.1 hypothetical protein FOB60_003406 [Candida parapsilosis]KAF6053155.1 hypothetical protein FOB59_001437 [Candida parapsilosis]KAF6064928.1 hypothetical protein FOB61_003354 [Candida parapsilosis]KAI5910809.1 hypothetical protein K4G61_g4510 [Candida parapsilosis]
MSSTTSLTTDSQVTFQYCNEAVLELHCSPFGLSGIYIRIAEAAIMGIGSTLGSITGSTRGLIHYNHASDLQDQKYKLYVVIDEEGMLRIDFTKITIQENESENGNKGDDEEQLPDLIFKGPCPEGRPDNVEPFIGIFSFEKE